LRIMIEKNLDLDLRLLIEFSLELHEPVKVDDALSTKAL
jgi:glycyl-tRNA synthetase beta chain